jgi:phosphoglycerate dehydrogenase-like enzyme
MNICIIDAKQFITDEKLIEPLYKLGNVSMYDGIPQGFDEAVKRAKDADIVLFALMKFTNEIIDNLPNLKVLQFIGTGVWNFVDVDYAEKKGIKVLNIEGYGNNAVAEFALSCAFSLARKITNADRILKERRWSLDNLEGIEIEGSVFGVVGTGNIGSIVAKKACLLGAEVIACDIYESDELKNKYGIKYVSLNEIFEKSDIISIHMKATKETEKIIGKDLLTKMKKGSLFINVARAELVDNELLYDLLKGGQIAGAAIDVYENEPPKDYKLAELENVIATPHIGFYTKKANDNSIRLSVESVLNFLDIDSKNQ